MEADRERKLAGLRYLLAEPVHVSLIGSVSGGQAGGCEGRGSTPVNRIGTAVAREAKEM